MNDYILKASRLIGEIQQLAVLVQMQTEMGCELRFYSNVEEVNFLLAPTKEIHEIRSKEGHSEELVQSSFYISTDFWNKDVSDQQRTIAKLLKIKRLLIKVLKEKRIDYGTLDYTIETVEYKQYVI